MSAATVIVTSVIDNLLTERGRLATLPLAPAVVEALFDIDSAIVALVRGQES